MHQFYILEALLIGFSVVLVETVLTKNLDDPLNSKNSPTINSPKNPQNDLQSPIQPPQTPNHSPNQPANQSPKLPNNQQINQPKELPKRPIQSTDLITEDISLKDESTDKNPLPGELAVVPDINEPSDYDLEPKDDESEEMEFTENEPKLHERKEYKHKEVHEHNSKTIETNSSDQKINFILLISYFRAGSSFVGDLFQQTDQTFYTFEPLKFFEFNHKVDDEDEDEALRVIENIFKCSIEEEEEYSDWMCDPSKTHAGTSIYRNHLLWKSCQTNHAICCDSNYVDTVCSQTKTRVIKETRLSLESIDKLYQRLSNSIDLKVVFLVRDPRSIFSSRQHHKWCQKTSCIDVNQLCQDLTSDLKVYPRLVEKYGNKVMIARFEDIALDPLAKGEALFSALELPFTSNVINFIETHTNEANTEPNDPYSIIHNSKEVITKWLSKLNETIVNEMQDSCEFVFDQLGYKPIVLSEITDPNDDEDLKEIYDPIYSLPNHL